ncbi:hypothetical protein L2747_18770 [Shewanella marinintestina]|uniref:hypothetical protein n=1 Tax=Shewanella marinintestina TaxID=190305 RepID=UPI00200FACAB|nr:hypothetical protein [Shewanella marinintestina]MCL1148050.1 hypothetical protein [Shewanella marinintestina]
MKQLILASVLLASFSTNAGILSSIDYALNGFCYDSTAAAWAACNDDYNGKCRYLGDSYNVCSDYDADDGYSNGNEYNLDYSNQDSTDTKFRRCIIAIDIAECRELRDDGFSYSAVTSKYEAAAEQAVIATICIDRGKVSKSTFNRIINTMNGYRLGGYMSDAVMARIEEGATAKGRAGFDGTCQTLLK